MAARRWIGYIVSGDCSGSLDAVKNVGHAAVDFAQTGPIRLTAIEGLPAVCVGDSVLSLAHVQASLRCGTECGS